MNGKHSQPDCECGMVDFLQKANKEVFRLKFNAGSMKRKIGSKRLKRPRPWWEEPSHQLGSWSEYLRVEKAFVHFTYISGMQIEIQGFESLTSCTTVSLAKPGLFCFRRMVCCLSSGRRTSLCFHHIQPGSLILNRAALGATFSSSVSASWQPLVLPLVPPHTLLLR